ncbi:MAG: sigma-54-dependent transcriptional regulator [Planctomycetota bacterium]
MASTRSMRILVVDDEPIVREGFARALNGDGFEVETAGDGQEAMDRLAARRFDLVITDLRMPEVDGQELLRHVKGRYPETEVVVLTGYGSIPNAVDAIKDGAYNYITKPLNKHELLRMAREIAEKVELRGRVEQLQSQLEQRYGLHNLIGRSPAMQAVYDLIERVRDSDCNVVITGESGTGKELVARAIHFTGRRADTPFVAVNCGALPDTIVERELFGHEAGAFTGAVRTQPGYFESAHGGTIFLDEFTELSAAAQVKLLRVIQQREIVRVGATAPMPVDVRILAATNGDPEACVAQGSLREDLYYRLNVLTIHVPPLRERAEDIPLLVRHFLHERRPHPDQPPKRITQAALDALIAYSWPGNVRELENVIERAVTLSARPVLDADDLPRLQPLAPAAAPDVAGMPLPEAKRQLTESFERDAITKALRDTDGNVTQAAKTLGIARSALQRLLRRHGIDADAYRE